MFITHTQSQNHTKVHMVIFTFWKSLSCLRSVLSQTLSLYFPHYSKLEKTEETLPIFMSLRLKWLRRSWLGDGTVGGGRAGLGQRTLLGQGAVLLGHGALLFWAGCWSRAVEFCSGKPKRQMKSGWHLIKGKRWPEMVPLPPHMTQGYGSCSFC